MGQTTLQMSIFWKERVEQLTICPLILFASYTSVNSNFKLTYLDR